MPAQESSRKQSPPYRCDSGVVVGQTVILDFYHRDCLKFLAFGSVVGGLVPAVFQEAGASGR